MRDKITSKITGILKVVVLNVLHFILRNRLTERLSSNRFSQGLIREIVLELEYLQGIGAGAGVSTSGEKVACHLLSRSEGTKLIFDVGANTGNFTKMIDSRVDDVSIHLFEPQNELVSKLSTEYNQDGNIHVNGCALSDEKTTSDLYYDEQGSGLASLSKRDLSHHDIDFNQGETVETRTLDWYCKKNDIKKLHWLKIDVEGHELNVLRGAERMISSNQIDYISFEFGGANIDTRTFLRDYYKLFDENGYRIYRILPSEKLYEMKSYKEVDEKFRVTNYVAVRDSIKI